jgi:hypothetical protein
MNPRIEWSEKSGKRCLRFTFGESLTEREAEFAIMEWKRAFQSTEDESIVLIWDCTEMKEYDKEARVKWTGALDEMKSQIDTIWLISSSSIIRMGATIMSMFSSLKLKAVSSESKIEI